ncbi:MAG: PrgI family protein [Candidatus Paceibacterota bacterium]
MPQFIEHQAKIIGPMTFNQFIYMALAGGVCFILYFALPFSMFIAACIIIIGGAAALAFLKINGRSLPAVLGSFLKFSFMPKMYIWKKKQIILRKTADETAEGSPLNVIQGGQLKKIKTKIETK